MEVSKRCKKCGAVKPITEFYRDRTRHDGIYPQCKDCCRKPPKPKPPPGKWSRVKKTCEYCLICFERKPSLRDIERGDIGKYCSDICYRLAERPKTKFKSCQVYFIECEVCGKMYAAKQKNMHTCSDGCRAEYNRNRTLEYDKANKLAREIKCKECGALFINEYGIKNRTFCSTSCCNKNNRRVAKAKRRARKDGIDRESVNPLKVFARDSWRCQLCGAKTPRKYRGTLRDDAPELDHIIPLSSGGSHTYKNTQCACRKCNGNKGAKALGQLRLC